MKNWKTTLVGCLAAGFIAIQPIVATGDIDIKALVYAFFIAYGLFLIGLEVPGVNGWLELTDPGALAWAVVWVCVAIQIVFVELLKLVVRTVLERYAIKADQETGDGKMPSIVQLGQSTDPLKDH